MKITKTRLTKVVVLCLIATFSGVLSKSLNLENDQTSLKSKVTFLQFKVGKLFKSITKMT